MTSSTFSMRTQVHLRAPTIILAVLAVGYGAIASTCPDPIAGSPFSFTDPPFTGAGRNADTVLVSPDGTKLFVGNQTNQKVSVLDIGGGGTLTFNNFVLLSPANRTAGLATNPSGSFLYVDAFNLSATLGSSVHVFSVGMSGSLTPVQSFNKAGSRALNGIAYVSTGTGDFVYVNNNIPVTNTISIYSVNTSTGMLTFVADVPTGGAGSGAGFFGGRKIAHDAANGLLFATNMGSSSISAFTIGAGGALVLTDVELIGATSSGSIALGPTGSTLYVATGTPTTPGNIVTMSVGAFGALTNTGSVNVFPTRVAGLAVHPSGNYVLASRVDVAGEITLLDATTLLPVPGSPVSDPAASGIDLSADGSRLFVGHADVTMMRVGVYVVDTVAPEITLNGANPMIISCGSSFVDPGATAQDDQAGDITADIVVTGTVDTDHIGQYFVNYTVEDHCGNQAVATRTVIVKADVVGFLAPMAALVPEGNTAPLPNNAFKAGKTIPLKLMLFCGTTQLTNLDVAAPEIVGLTRNGDAVPLATIDPGVLDGEDIAFTYNTDHWKYNLGTKTLISGTYEITLQMPDGLRYVARFVLR